MRTLTLLTLNCFDVALFSLRVRKPRMKKLISELVRMDADILCLQEIVFPDTADLYRRTLEDHGYRVFTETVSGFLTKGDLMTATKFPVSNARFIPFESQGRLLSLDIVERTVVKGYHRMLINPDPEKSVTVINTHLHCPFGNYDTPDLPDVTWPQWEQLIRSERRTSRMVVAGDLNVIPGNAIFTKFPFKLIDPLRRSGAVTLTPENTNRKHLHKMKSRIDYTLVTPDLARGVSQRVVLDAPVRLENGEKHHLSDHSGLWTRITF